MSARALLTANTITDDQIRNLRASYHYARNPDARLLERIDGHLVCDLALTMWRVSKVTREQVMSARARCAEILNENVRREKGEQS